LLHRDLKPANVMLTPHGLKVLDFGLARAPRLGSTSLATEEGTIAGTIVGTPGYLAPEVINGAAPDERVDIFAAGAVLFEMLCARPAFPGATPLAIVHAVLHERPPALTGGPVVAALDRVVRQALDKEPRRRFESAQAMAAAIRVVQRPDVSTPVIARATRRMVVLPFRALRQDTDAEFLCASLPDAVTATLSQLQSVVLRSALLGARFGPAPDLAQLAAEGDVDVALTGSLFRAGDDIRMTAQLIEVPGGVVLQSSTYQAPARNIVDLHDAIVQNIVRGLSEHLSAGERDALIKHAPASQTAYALFLRGNELTRDRRRVAEAVSRYQESLALDPHYAPAWAQMGRAYRLRAKYEADPSDHLEAARNALDRALALDPDLDLAHSVYAQLEADTGSSRAAMERLVRRGLQGAAAPEIYGSLVYACRFCGLTAESITFHHEARRRDPSMSTSVTQTYFQSGDYLRSLETAGDDIGYIGPTSLDAMGRTGDAIDELRKRVQADMSIGGGRLLLESLLAALEGDREQCVALTHQFGGAGYVGCEAQAYLARQLIRVGELSLGLEMLERSIRAGFHHVQWFETDPWWQAARGSGGFVRLLDFARSEHDRSRRAFDDAGGERLLAVRN
jgi:non-specific serine/threonine protein kinase